MRLHKKCSLALAKAIVECWQADAQMIRISDDAWPDGRPFIRKLARCQAWLASANKPASDALWAGLPNKATNLLMRFGVRTHGGQIIDKEIIKARRDFEKANIEDHAYGLYKEATNRGPRQKLLHK